MKEVTIEVAKRYLASGLAVLPASKAEKRPLVGAWKTYRKRPPTTAELESWFAQTPDALCLVTGGVSGNLECIDFDHHAELYDRWKSRLDPAVLNSLVIERTQSSGIHAFYRCEEAVEGNMKLARGIRDGKSATLIGTALWGRAYEKVRKLAMVYALSENPYQPQLSKEGATWAYEIVGWSVRRLLHKASLFMFSTGFEEIAVRIRRALATAGGTLQRRDALRASRVDSATFGKVMDTMLETGEVIQEVRSSATKSATVYRSAARKPSRRRS